MLAGSRYGRAVVRVVAIDADGQALAGRSLLLSAVPGGAEPDRACRPVFRGDHRNEGPPWPNMSLGTTVLRMFSWVGRELQGSASHTAPRRSSRPHERSNRRGQRERARPQPKGVGGWRVVTLTRLNRLVTAIQSTNAASTFSS
jgi:hypothetical protein